MSLMSLNVYKFELHWWCNC